MDARKCIRIAYCEDEPIQAVYLRESLELCKGRQDFSYELSVYKSAEEMLFENEEMIPFDLLILDIEMGKMNGMELARQIRKRDPDVWIVFLTNNREYALEGYEVEAARYLIKPLDEHKLQGVLGLIQERTEHKAAFLFTSEGEKRKLYVEEILFLESDRHYVRICTRDDKTYSFKRNLQELESLPVFSSFVKCHRSYFVNLDHVRRVTRDQCVLENGQVVPVSRGCYQEFQEAFITYHMGKE